MAAHSSSGDMGAIMADVDGGTAQGAAGGGGKDGGHRGR